MRTVSEETMIRLTHENFDKYVSPLIESLVIGDVVSVRYKVEMNYSSDKDWVAKTRFRNTPNVSVYNGVAHIMDILNLCRTCKVWLVTEEIFDIISIYYWINPVYRTQFLGVTGTEADYESMLYTADKHAQVYIQKNVPNITSLQSVILRMLKYYTMKLTNKSPKNVNPYLEFDQAEKEYKSYMEKNHWEAYKTARRFKAQPTIVSEDGFIILEQTKSDEDMLKWPRT